MGSNTLTLPPRAFTARSALKAAIVVILGAMTLLPVFLGIRAGAYDSFADSALMGFGFWGNFTIHMWTRPSRKEWLSTVGLGLAMRLAYDLAVGERGYPGSLVIGMGTFLGLASLMVMGVQWFEATGARREACRRSLGFIAVFTYLGFSLNFYLTFAKQVLPLKFDHYLYNFDGSLGLQLAFLAGRLLNHFPPLYTAEVIVYNSFGYWFAVVYAAHANARSSYPLNVVKMLIVNPMIGFSLYFLCPAMGPRFAFPSFPGLPGAVQSAPLLMSGIPNAIPSQHFAGALLILWFSRPWKWLHRGMIVFAALTALATVGTGEHYVVDLVVAAPYALAILAFCSKVPERKQPLIVGAALVLFWLAALRYLPFFSPGVSWALVLWTLGVVIVLQRRLAARIWGATPSSDVGQLGKLRASC